MSSPVIGMFVGILLAIAGILGGFGGFILAVVLGAVGYVVAGQLTGRFDVAEMARGRSRG